MMIQLRTRNGLIANWFASLLASQDPVALDSVGYDLVCTEPNMTKQPDGRPNPSFNGYIAFKIYSLGNDAAQEKVLCHYKNVRIVTENPASCSNAMDLEPKVIE
jgi:hypothetical protein